MPRTALAADRAAGDGRRWQGRHRQPRLGRLQPAGHDSDRLQAAHTRRRDHDFLWRVHPHVPGPGKVASRAYTLHRVPRGRARREREMPTDETTHLYEYPSGTGTAPSAIAMSISKSLGFGLRANSADRE